MPENPNNFTADELVESGDRPNIYEIVPVFGPTGMVVALQARNIFHNPDDSTTKHHWFKNEERLVRKMLAFFLYRKLRTLEQPRRASSPLGWYNIFVAQEGQNCPNCVETNQFESFGHHPDMWGEPIFVSGRTISEAMTTFPENISNQEECERDIKETIIY